MNVFNPVHRAVSRCPDAFPLSHAACAFVTFSASRSTPRRHRAPMSCTCSSREQNSDQSTVASTSRQQCTPYARAVMPSPMAPPRNSQPSPPGRTPRAPDYYANVGSVIEHLRADYPELLLREPNLDYYAENMVFTERASGYTVSGKEAYGTLLWALRFQTCVFLIHPTITIQSLFHDDDSGAIYLRWRLQATPRVWGLMRKPPVYIKDSMSIYRLNAKGFVCEHDLDNSMPIKPKLRPIIEEIISLGTIRARGLPELARAGACVSKTTDNMSHVLMNESIREQNVAASSLHQPQRRNTARKASRKLPSWFRTLELASYVDLDPVLQKCVAVALMESQVDS